MLKILVIEDQTDIQDLLQAILTPQYQVLTALDGIQALQVFNAQTPDLIILDLMLPNITGASVLKTIRKTSMVPVIVLTAIQDKTNLVKLLTAGANDYLTKPFDIDELLARIQVQLRSHQPQPVASTSLTFGEIQLNPITHQIIVAGQPLVLPKKEFNLLKIMLAHPHQVFEKAQLYETVWGEPYEHAENTLNVHLSNLRIKVNELAATPQYIISVWGIGVRLV